jgi:hypothetical protein
MGVALWGLLSRRSWIRGISLLLVLLFFAHAWDRRPAQFLVKQLGLNQPQATQPPANTTPAP